MFSYSIIPLDIDHIQEICDDIVQQYETGVAQLALFAMRMEPVGRPMADIVGSFINKYTAFRDELAKRGAQCGMLVQATIGHGGPLGDRLTFSPCINLTDGKEINVSCPYDPGFVDHFRNVMERLAALSPGLIMVDDDFRLMSSRSGRGCACPLHMAEFNRRAGTAFTREELLEKLSQDSEEARRYGEIFAAVQNDSRLKAARAMREGIDRVNPKLPGAFCTCGNEDGGEIARILAGEGNPSILRLNNGNYSNNRSTRKLTYALGRAAMQKALDCNKADVYLAETDTFPRNRYAVSAYAQHTHYVGTILEGASGAKHFITRLRQFEPNSGKAYRAVLGKYAGFYAKLSEIVREIKWEGAAIPLPRKIDYSLQEKPFQMSWMGEVLERLGLPVYFAKEPGKLSFLSADAPAFFSRDEILGLLSQGLVLTAEAAEQLEKAGYGEYLGISVRDYAGKKPVGELLCASGIRTELQYGIRELVPMADGVEIESYACAFIEGQPPEKLFPSSTSYRNSLGGTVVVFAGNPLTPHWESLFSFLNESRKQQFIDLFNRAGCLPVYYPGDTDVYLRAGSLPDGRMLVAFFNIGLDPIDRLTLVSKRAIARAEFLDCDGTLKDVSFTRNDREYTFDIAAPTLAPVVLVCSGSEE